MASTIKTLLQSVGLSKREADVYLASLRLGEATVQDIAHSARLPRTTVASILERLRTEGFVALRNRQGNQIYWIEDPHILVEKEKARLEVISELAGRLHIEYHAEDHKPSASVADTREGILNLMTHVIEETPVGGEILTIDVPSAKHYQAVMSDELFHALSKRKVTRDIRTRTLIPLGHEGAIRPSALRHNIEVRILPAGLTFETALWIYGNSIAIFSGTHTFAVGITHRHTAESMASLFRYLWDHATPLLKPTIVDKVT